MCLLSYSCFEHMSMIYFHLQSLLKTADQLKIRGLCEVPDGEEDIIDNTESITDVSVLGTQFMHDKAQKQKFFSRIRGGKVATQMKRKFPHDLNAKKQCIKEVKSVDQQNVQLIQTTTINPNDILDTTGTPQVLKTICFLMDDK